MRFEKGDRVRITKDLTDGRYAWSVGLAATIVRYVDALIPIYEVRIDDHESQRFYCFDGEIEPLVGAAEAPAAAKPPTAIVARLHQGNPRPSYRPYVHPDRSAALAEAERLAHMEPGAVFAVYERVGAVVVEPAKVVAVAE